jgi:hypothetical protein
MSLFEQSITINPEEFDIQKYMNDDNIKTITYEQILQDVYKFKLTGIPYIDIMCVKNLGDFIHKKFNNDKWEICPNLIDEIYTEFKKNLLDCDIQYTNIEQHISKLRKNYEDPESINVKMEMYMTDYLRSIYWKDKSNEENIEKYFSNKKIINNIMKQIKFKYESEWDEYNQKSEHIKTVLSKNFEESEDDPKYIESEMLFEKINNDACKYIKPIHEHTVEKIKSEYQNYVVLNPNTNLNEFDKIHKELKNEFKEEVEKVYKQVLLDNKIDKNIQSHILELFVIEKSMHMFNLSFDLTELTLSQLN